MLARVEWTAAAGSNTQRSASTKFWFSSKDKELVEPILASQAFRPTAPVLCGTEGSRGALWGKRWTPRGATSSSCCWSFAACSSHTQRHGSFGSPFCCGEWCLGRPGTQSSLTSFPTFENKWLRRHFWPHWREMQITRRWRSHKVDFKKTKKLSGAKLVKSFQWILEEKQLGEVVLFWFLHKIFKKTSSKKVN